MDKIIKITLAMLFFLCLLPMPYGFYQLVRFVALIGFTVLSFEAYKEGKSTETMVFIALALLFQPLIKIPLGRTIWNVVDIIVGVGLIASIFKHLKGR